MCRLTQEERYRLRGLSAHARVMYMEHFREFVNFETGIYDKRMSTQAWKELLEFVPDWGSRKRDSGLPEKRKQLENFIAARKEELIRAGLLFKIDSFVFKLPEFSIGLFRPEKEQGGNKAKEGANIDAKSLNNNENEKSEQGVNESGSKPPLTTTTTTGDLKFQMRLDWQSDRDLFVQYLQMWGCDPKKVQRAWVAEFKGYWFTRSDVVKTQKEWTIYFANRMIQFLRNPALFERLNGSVGFVAADEGRAKAGAGSKPSGDYIPAVPRAMDDSLVVYAAKYGFSEPKMGQGYADYQSTLRIERDRRLNGRDKVLH